MTAETDWQALYLWLLAIILVPYCLPLVGILLMRLVPFNVQIPPAALRVVTALKDGQMGWITIALGCGLLYDLWEFGHRTDFLLRQATSINQVRALLDQRGLRIWHTLLEIGAICVVSALTVTTSLGGTFPTSYQGSFQNGWPQAIRHYRIMITTLVMSLLASGGYIAIHIWITRHEGN